jgi:hypothetical protein
MKTRFKSEKHAREETIGRAALIAGAALHAGREFNEREKRKVELLLTTAESLGLGTNLPRDAKSLAKSAAKPEAATAAIAAEIARDNIQATAPGPKKRRA